MSNSSHPVEERLSNALSQSRLGGKLKGKQGSAESLPKIEVHPCGFWEMLLIESSFAFLARNLGSKTRLFPQQAAIFVILIPNEALTSHQTKMSDEEEADNSNSCTETGESDYSLSDLGIDSQNYIQLFMFEQQHGSSSKESHSSEEQGDNNEQKRSARRSTAK